MRTIFLCLLTLSLGCGTQEVVQLPPVVTQDQLVGTLDQIAATGQYDDVLTGLTMGLEEAGLMGEAATVQQWPGMGDESRVKKSAKQLSKVVQKQLASAS